MKRDDMRCRNCIFIEKGSHDDTCRVKANSIVDNDDHVIDFPIILNARHSWCGQGEWEGPAPDNANITVFYRWGEWDK
jgi:hypothetical protein